jgi:hypothetical protein
LVQGHCPSLALAAEIRVTTTTQEITGTGDCSLQEAIYSANFDRNVAIDSTNPDHFIATECESGSGDDVIVLPERAEFFMARVLDDAHNHVGPTATPIVFSNITIEAHGAHLQRSFGAGNFRAFAVGFTSVELNPGGTPEIVSGTGRLTIRNAHIEGFAIKGGDGATGGGGGLGAGGAIRERWAVLAKGRGDYCLIGRKPRCSYCRGTGVWQLRPPTMRPGIAGRPYISKC